jgi:hypothetical protein
VAEPKGRGGKGKGKGKKEETVTPEEYMFELGFAMDLINSDPSLQEWITRVRRYMDKNKGRTPTPFEMQELKQGISWFERYNSDQELARMQQADPRTRDDFNRSLELRRERVRAIATQYGVALNDTVIDSLALAARLDQLTDTEIQTRITPYLETAVAAGEDLTGRAADSERELLQWSQRNGLKLTGQMLSRYVSAVARGDQSIDDAKDDLRRTYLIGQYPGWSDRIEQGFDPADIAEPYRERMAALLEMDEMEIDLNDNLLQRGMQSVGADGKPRVMPMYEFEQEIRKDPRWEYTDNAYDVYSRVGTNLLRTFGFR